MRRLFERLRQEIEDFIEQRDDLLMLVACTADDAPIVLKTLRDIELATATDVFLLFSDTFISPASFVSVAVDRLKEEHRIACEALAEGGLDPLPPLPQAVFNASQPPADRLRETMLFARSLLPRKGGHRLVWAMFPQEIEDRQAYLDLVSSFVPWKGVRSWMQGLRIIFRDEADSRQLAPRFANAPRVRVAQVNLGPDAMAASIEEDVHDEELPIEQRMQSLFTVACLDYAHHRVNDAITKFNILLGYYQHTGNSMMQALVMNGMGDVFHRSANLDKAQYWYECAVTPAVDAQVPVVLATITRNLGDVAYKLSQYAEAEQYFDGLDKLAAYMLDPENKARALEWRGLSQEKQEAYMRAMKSWEDAAMLSRNIGLPTFLKTNLEHLRRVYPQLHMHDKLAAAEAELTQLESQEVSV